MNSSKLPADLLATLENKAVFRSLAEQVCSNAGVIPFVGAGLSAPFGFPLWSDFLRTQASIAGIEQSINDRLKSGQFEEAAQDLLDARGPARFGHAIEDEFGNHKLEGQPLNSAVSYVPILSSGPVLTTNFDRVLEHVFKSAGAALDLVVGGARVGLAASSFQQGDRILIKLHGDWKDADDRVLTLDQYRSAYGALEPSAMDFSRPLPTLLRLALQNRPLLFLGCSLQADRTIQVLHNVARDLPTLVHFAILPQPASVDFARRDRFLSDLGIRAFWYPPGRHEFVELILADIAQMADQESGSRFGRIASAHTAPHASGAEILGITRHSTIRRAVLNGRPVIVKRTKKEICSFAALKAIVSKQIIGHEGRTVATVVTPESVQEVGEDIEEIQHAVEGTTLEQIVLANEPRMRGDLIGEIFNALLQTINELHELGVLHRDICPGNVLLSIHQQSVRVHLIDCSFAWLTNSRPQIRVRTPNYTAPEQVQGEASAKSDWYSLAATMWFAATGRAPYRENQHSYDRELFSIDTGQYVRPSTLPRKTEHRAWPQPYMGAFVFDALLDPDPTKRPSAVGDIMLRTASCAAAGKDARIVGVVDICPYGAIIFHEEDNDYVIVPAPEITKFVADAISAQRSADDGVRRQLTNLLRPLPG